MLKQVTYTTLFVRVQGKALDFYVNTLGFEKRAAPRSSKPSAGVHRRPAKFTFVH
jgi:hypothetical protein